MKVIPTLICAVLLAGSVYATEWFDGSNIKSNTVESFSLATSTLNVISNAVINPVSEPTTIPVVNGTATVTRAFGTTGVLTLTNDTTLAFSEEFTSNSIGRVSIDISVSTHSLTLPTNGVGTVFTWDTTPEFSTNSYTPTYFRKKYNTLTWEVKQ